MGLEMGVVWLPSLEPDPALATGADCAPAMGSGDLVDLAGRPPPLCGANDGMASSTPADHDRAPSPPASRRMLVSRPHDAGGHLWRRLGIHVLEGDFIRIERGLVTMKGCVDEDLQFCEFWQIDEA